MKQTKPPAAPLANPSADTAAESKNTKAYKLRRAKMMRDNKNDSAKRKRDDRGVHGK